MNETLIPYVATGQTHSNNCFGKRQEESVVDAQQSKLTTQTTAGKACYKIP